jgi:hypothetical protein
MTRPGTPLSTRVIGQAERTLNAILGRQLAGTGLTGDQWVILTMAVTAGGTAGCNRFTRMVAGALKISESEAEARIGDMVTAQHLEIASDSSAVTATAAAQNVHSRISTAVAAITDRLWGGLPADDLATAARVLTIVTDRATAELAQAQALSVKT